MNSASLNLDLTGLETKWGNQNVCADCGKDFDRCDYGDEDEAAHGFHVPLQMFRGKGKNTQMLVLCWSPCAALRMQNKAHN